MKKTIKHNSEGTDPQVKEGKSKYKHQKEKDNTCFFCFMQTTRSIYQITFFYISNN